MTDVGGTPQGDWRRNDQRTREPGTRPASEAGDRLIFSNRGDAELGRGHNSPVNAVASRMAPTASHTRGAIELGVCLVSIK